MKRMMMVMCLLMAGICLFAQKKAPDNRLIEKNIPSLSEVWKGHFSIGTCVAPEQLFGPESELLVRHYSSLTAENVMKPAEMAPKEGVYNFTDADTVVAFARQHNQLVRGHTLVWHEQAAQWMFTDGQGHRVSKAVLLKRLEQYIKTVVGRDKGKVSAWDGVNEAADRRGLRRSPWFEICGEDYIDAAFRFARAADPDAKLFLNEIEVFDKEKGEQLYQLVKRLLARKVPLDGIGLQFHISLFNPTLETIAATLNKFDSLGLEIHITELDMSLNGDPNLKADNAPEDFLIRQAHRYREIFDLFRAHRRITNVTFWGFNDGHTWLTYAPVKKPDWPLLFDRNLKAKLSYWALVDPTRLPKDVVVDQNRNAGTAVAVRGTPVIDGVEDKVWQKARELPIAIFVQGEGATGTGKALWDKDNLYVLVKVKDPVLSKKNPNSYEQDSVEIFVDEKNNKSSEYLEDDAQYRINFTNNFSSRGNPATITSAAKVGGDGYLIEVKIPFRFVKGAAGVKLGFDLQINDDPGSGRRESYSKWNDPTNESFRNTSGFGTLVLE